MGLVSLDGVLKIICLTLLYMAWWEGVRAPGTEATDSCELQCGCWELNPGPVGEQPVLLIAEPSL